MKKRRRVSRNGVCNAVFGLAWYRPEQYQHLLEVSEDRDKMDSTFEEWQKSAWKAVRNFAANGVPIRKVDVDVEELVIWCRARDLPINGAARSSFAAEKVEQQTKAEQELGDT